LQLTRNFLLRVAERLKPCPVRFALSFVANLRMWRRDAATTAAALRRAEYNLRLQKHFFNLNDA
jgi:hypothetical protein